MYLKESILSKVATSSAALKMDYFKQAFFEEFFAQTTEQLLHKTLSHSTAFFEQNYILWNFPIKKKGLIK